MDHLFLKVVLNWLFPTTPEATKTSFWKHWLGELMTHTSDELIKVKKTKTRCFLHLNIGLYAFFCQLYCQLLVSFSWGKNQFLKSLNLSAFFDELCPHSCYLAQMSTKTAAPAPTVSAGEWHTVLEDSIPEGFGRYTGFARELLQQPLGTSTKWSSLLART